MQLLAAVIGGAPGIKGGLPTGECNTSSRRSEGGRQGWAAQEFEDPAVAARIRHIVEPAHEQNLDRLVAALAGG